MTWDAFQAVRFGYGVEHPDPAPLREREAAAIESRCGCGQPASATRTTKHADALAARRAAVGRRLRQLAARVTGNHEEGS